MKRDLQEKYGDDVVVNFDHFDYDEWKKAVKNLRYALFKYNQKSLKNPTNKI